MGKGGYRGGSTLIGQGSGWFSVADPKTDRVHAVGKAEGEAALEKVRLKERALKDKILAANAKLAKNSRHQENKAKRNREALIAAGKATEPPEAGSKAAISFEKTEALMRQVEVVKKPTKPVFKK